MSNAPHEWTLKGFVDHFKFVHDKMPDHKFVWMLGAGASLASGIPLGSTLVDDWLKQIHLRQDPKETPLDQWATAENLGIADFEYKDRARFYAQIYQRRFPEHPDEGYAYLEDAMAGADPSPGYSILATALAHDPPRHNAVVTTNFDNLVADALSIYTNTFPFVCGHESLAPFVKVAMRRPVVCKIHRDLLLSPQNDPRSLQRLHDAWGMPLRALFEHYTPLFIGYGGNDDTLMHLLKSLHPGDIKGQMIWCYHEDSEPSERIVNMVADHKGVLVPVPDFDLLMVLLGETMDIPLLDEEIGRRADARTRRYIDRIQRLDTVRHPEVTKAAAATMKRRGGWWAWYQKAKSETDPQRREIVYRQGIGLYPQSAHLHGNFANFMANVRGKYDEAERFYRKGLELDPKLANTTGNLANLMKAVRGEHDEAEQLYRKALELAPKDAGHTADLASFLTSVRGEHDEAERLYRKALELDPKDANITGNFANFMTNARGDHDEAERLYRTALELDSKNGSITANFAIFMTNVRGDHDEAEGLYRKALELDPASANNTGDVAIFGAIARGDSDEVERLYRKALELDPEDANKTGNLAIFLSAFRGDHGEVERLYRKALELDPNLANITGSFANFMTDVRGNHDEAERLYRKALELDPKDAIHTGNFASFMTDVRGDHDEAERLYRKALKLDPKIANTTSNFAHFMKDARGNHDEAERLYRKAFELDPKDANHTGNYASFMTDVRGNHDEAERLYRKALKLDPKNANVTGSCAEFLLAQGRIEESAAMLERAKALNSEQKNQFAAAIALNSAILAGVTERDDTHVIEELRNILSNEFIRGNWDFKNVLAYAKGNVSPEDHALYSAFAEAIFDAEKVPAALTLLDQRSAASSDGKSKARKRPARKKTSKKTAKKRAKAKKPRRKKKGE